MFESAEIDFDALWALHSRAQKWTLKRRNCLHWSAILPAHFHRTSSYMVVVGTAMVGKVVLARVLS